MRHTVVSCADCPMLAGEPDAGSGLFCGHPETNRQLSILESQLDEGGVLAACPLKADSLLISLGGSDA